jgi:uncharacterized protein YbjT (DUF2867 family)
LVLLAGSTGYLGRRLLPRLEALPINVRCLARNPDALRATAGPDTQIVRGNVLDPQSLDVALAGVETAYYLIHQMTGGSDFVETDRQAARNFAAAARRAGVRRLIYLGGLGDDRDPSLSPHLQSRHEVGQILRDSGLLTIELRAGMVVGAGSLSFELLRSLTERLPVMICPRWLLTPMQPIAVSDAVAYLLAARVLPLSESRVFEIGGPDTVTYAQLIKLYARLRGLRRWLISVPVLTPYFSGLWLALVTPTSFKVGRHLIEGLRNPMVVRNQAALAAFSIRPLGIEAALRIALDDARS